MKQIFWIERLYFEKEQFTEILYRARIRLWHIDTTVPLLWHLDILAIALSLHWVRSSALKFIQFNCTVSLLYNKVERKTNTEREEIWFLRVVRVVGIRTKNYGYFERCSSHETLTPSSGDNLWSHLKVIVNLFWNLERHQVLRWEKSWKIISISILLSSIWTIIIVVLIFWWTTWHRII